MPKLANLVSLKPAACGQTVLPDRSILIGQKISENTRIKKFKCDFLGDFQTVCRDAEQLFFLWFSLPINAIID